METIALITDVIVIILALYVFDFLLSNKSNTKTWLKIYFERKKLEEEIKLKKLKAEIAKDNN